MPAVYDQQGNVISSDGEPFSLPQSDTLPDDYSSLADSISAKITAFRAQAQSLYQTVQDYEDAYAAIQDNPALVAKWEANYKRLFAAQRIAANAEDAITAVTSWWNDLTSAFGGSNGTLGGLGVAIAIPWATIAIITAAGASIGVALYSASVALREFRRYSLQKTNEARAAQGLPPIDDPYGKETGVFENISGIVKAAAFAFVAYQLLQKVK